MSTQLGIIDLDALPEMDEKELAEIIKGDLSALPAADQDEILEIARDLFTPEELKYFFGKGSREARGYDGR